MTSFRQLLAVRVGGAVLLLCALVGVASVFALRSILSRQLDRTLLHLAEVEGRAGAAATSSDFEFHEGVLLTAQPGPSAELTRYAQLWTSDGAPVVRSRNLRENLELPPEALEAAHEGVIVWNTHSWRGETLRCVLYPMTLVGAPHKSHILQVAAPMAPLDRTVRQFGTLVLVIGLFATVAAYALGLLLARMALRPTEEITAQAEAVEAGSLSARITAHAQVVEFGRLVTVLNGMLERLERAFQIQRRFTADASHELRAPLTTLRGDIDVTLRRERSASEYRETLERCREEVLRLTRLTDDLLAMARADSALPLERREAVDVRALVERVANRYRSVAKERSVKVGVRGEAALVEGDPGVLERVVGNLIDNAIKFSPPAGTVRIEVDGVEDVQLRVADEGQGIAPAAVPHLFTRFFRGDGGQLREGGSGLGLSIARAGAEAHGGRLEFAGNAPGAVFVLSLPGMRSGGRPPAAKSAPSRK